MSEAGGGSRGKRKQSSADGGMRPGGAKKSKGSTAGKWKTPQQRAKMAGKIEMGHSLDVGDQGIWVTYARGMNSRAFKEFKELCDEYAEIMYNITKPKDIHDLDDTTNNNDEELDIEQSIEKELAAIKATRHPSASVSVSANKKKETFTLVSTGIECVFFVKTSSPVAPDALIRRICEDASACPDPRARKCRYINRLTPVFGTDKATENGVERVARRVLPLFFELVAAESETGTGTGQCIEDEETVEAMTRTNSSGEPVTYAIRHKIRNHKALKSEAVINKIADLVDKKHKVDLTNPDRVIQVEIFKTFCGISVVDGHKWEELKRYNVNALYGMTAQQKSGAAEAAQVADQGNANES